MAGSGASSSIEELVFSLIKKHGEGISEEALQRGLSEISVNDRMEALNRLLEDKRIQLFEAGPTRAIYYKELNPEEAAKFKGLGAEELLLYQIIKSAGNIGLWTKDMRTRSNLPQPHIAKILRTLEQRNLVKIVKNVNNPSRKVYMLAELEPSRDLTGGAWYTEHQFDSAFIEVLRDASYRFIERQGDTTIKEICAFIAAKKFAKVDLREEDVQSILQTLVYDGRVDTIDSDDPNDDAAHYRVMMHGPPASTPLTEVPCGICPVMDQCTDDGVISPATCVYYTKWLEF